MGSHIAGSPPPAMVSPPLGYCSGGQVGRTFLQEMLNGPGRYSLGLWRSVWPRGGSSRKLPVPGRECSGLSLNPPQSSLLFVEVSMLRPQAASLVWPLAGLTSAPRGAFRLSPHMIRGTRWGAENRTSFSQPHGLISWQGCGQTTGHQLGRTGPLGGSPWPEGWGR